MKLPSNISELRLILDEAFLNNTIQDYLIALGIFAGSWIFFKILKGWIFIKLEGWTKKTKTDVDDEFLAALEDVPEILYFFASLHFAFQALILPYPLEKGIEVISIILLFYWATKIASRLIEYSLYKMALKHGRKAEKNNTYMALTLVSKVLLWSVGILVILSNIGVNITALVASLGIGGIAVALAMQNILGDIFSSFSLYLDKPFEVGDFIIVGEHQGTVKKIGLKTTRIEALQGEEIVISNNELTSSRVRNFKRMKKRRVVFHIGVTYNTPHAKLSKIPKIVKEYIGKTPKCKFDRAHFYSFGPSSLDFEIVYYIDSNNYNDYMNTQQKLNLALVKAFEKEEIEFAFPTQTLYVHKSE